jgi:hypothetical protein
MIVPPGPFRLECNSEAIGVYKTLASLKSNLRKHLNKQQTPGSFQFKAFDVRGRLILWHDGKSLRPVLQDRPQVETPRFLDSKPLLAC